VKEKIRKRWRERYKSDPAFRESEKAKARKLSLKRYHKKMKEDPEWNAKRLREFKRKHQDTYNYLMCRYYFRRLSLDQRKKLSKEVGKGML